MSSEVAMIVGGVVLLLAGLLVVWLAIRSWQGRLSRNYIAGVRTPSTMRSDEAFRIANKVAAPFSLVGGVLLAVTGVAQIVTPARAAAGVVLTGVIIAAVVIVIGGLKGVRAARSAP
jgi:uncharacterized membrane protein